MTSPMTLETSTSSLERPDSISAVPATIFAIYAVLVSLCDSVLKPLFLGRGMDIPMLVILIGAIGGAISAGLLGLFLGPVVLAVGYKILVEWMALHAPDLIEEED